MKTKKTEKDTARMTPDTVSPNGLETALRQSEERYDALVHAIDEGFCIVEVLFDAEQNPIDYCFLEINSAFEGQTGLHDAEGKCVRELVPDLEAHWFDIYGRVALTGEPVRFINHAQAMESRWFDVYAFRVGDTDSRRVGILFRDITARRNAEERDAESRRTLSLLLRVSDATRYLTDPTDIARQACRLVRAELGGVSCSCGIVFPEDDLVRIIADANNADAGAPSLEGEWSLSGFGAELVALHERGVPVVIEDTATHPATAEGYTTTFVPLHIRSLVGIPLIRNGQFVAYFSLHDNVPRQYTDAEIALLSEVAVRVWESIQRSRAEDAQRESDTKFRMLADTMPQLVWSTLPDGFHDYYNARWFEYTGLTYEDTQGEKWNNVLHPDDQARAWEVWRHSLETGDPYEIEYRFQRHDGEYRWFIGRALPLRDAKGAITRWFGTCTDVDDQRRVAETQLEHQDEIQNLNTRLQRAMTETHHRVKNNLQVIAAMIDMQAGDYEEEQAVPLDKFLQLKTHIHTLSIVHDLLTHSVKEGEDIQRVSAKAVLERLLPMLQQTAGRGRVHYDVEDASLTSKQCVALSLIANELVSNALKHGDRETFVTFRVENNSAILTVEDDGAGFAEGFDPLRAANTGLELVHSLVRSDLQGAYQFGNRPQGGGQVTITFALPQDSEPV